MPIFENCSFSCLILFMKKFFNLLLIAGFLQLLSFQADALSAQSDAPDCYNQWKSVFDERGADNVRDGYHENVIVTVRTVGGNSDCFTGKVEVEGGRIARIWLRYVDGNYSLFTPNYKVERDSDRSGALVNNGSSRARRTVEDEIINVFFPSMLKPKKKEFERAPLPGDL
jgi:hypothetical protein